METNIWKFQQKIRHSSWLGNYPLPEIGGVNDKHPHDSDHAECVNLKPRTASETRCFLCCPLWWQRCVSRSPAPVLWLVADSMDLLNVSRRKSGKKRRVCWRADVVVFSTYYYCCWYTKQFYRADNGIFEKWDVLLRKKWFWSSNRVPAYWLGLRRGAFTCSRGDAENARHENAGLENAAQTCRFL